MLLILVAVCGVAAYVDAKRFGDKHGTFPGNVPPIGWGIFCFLLPLIGSLTQYFVGKNTLKKLQTSRGHDASSWTPPPAPGYPQLPAQQLYAAPQQYAPAPQPQQYSPPPASPYPSPIPAEPVPAATDYWEPTREYAPRPNVGGEDLMPRR